MEKNVATKLEDLNLINRFLFDEVMEDRESYQATVSILLGEDIELLDEPETEKELRVSPELREIRLDVVSMDKGGKFYYTEIYACCIIIEFIRYFLSDYVIFLVVM